MEIKKVLNGYIITANGRQFVYSRLIDVMIFMLLHFNEATHPEIKIISKDVNGQIISEQEAK